MEKLHKSKTLTGKKRKRDISVAGAASEPKNIKLHVKTSKKGNDLLIPKKIKSAKAKIASVEIKPKATTNVSTVELMKSHSASEAEPPKKVKKSKVTISESKNVKIDISKETTFKEEEESEPETENNIEKESSHIVKKTSSKAILEGMTLDDIGKKYPVLKNRELVEKFLKVQMSNNQKGRIRQAIKLSLQGASQTMFPDIIHGKIQAILKGSTDLTDSELRRIRILYNMLKSSFEASLQKDPTESTKKKKPKKKKVVKDGEEKEKKEKLVQKVKGPKRYVVFLGNLPLDINKEKIMEHFVELNENIKDIRLPKVEEGKKSAIAYVELMNEPSYELALSKHHSMLGSKRINVLYTAQTKSKISKSEVKRKSAKLIALQKSGKLVGSTPVNKKRSHRRAIMKKAKSKAEANV